MRVALQIARKDLRQRVRDKSAFIYGIVAPLGLAFIFAYVLGPIQDSTFHVEYVVLDQDGGDIALGFRQMLDSVAEEGGFATIREVDSLDEAMEQVETGSDAFAGDDEARADAAFVIPEGLTEDVGNNQGGTIEVLGAAGSALGAQIAYSLAQGFSSEVEAVAVSLGTVGVLPQEDLEVDPQALQAQAMAASNPISVKDMTASTKLLDSTTYMSAGMAVFFLFFTVAFGVSGLLEERRLGTMDRLLAAPISRRSILMGKALTSFVLGIVSMSVLAVASTLLLGADWGNPIGVAMLIVAAVFSAMGILAVVAATAKTQDQAGNFQAIISLVLAFLGGTFFSISQAGGFIEKLSLITPHAWFLRGLGDLQGGEISAVFPSVGALLAFGLVTGVAGWFFLTRSVER